MGTVSVKRKVSLLLGIAAGFVVLSGSLFLFYLFEDKGKEIDYAKVRLAVNQLESEIENRNGNIKPGEHLKKSEVSSGVMIIDPKGNVIFTQGKTPYRVNEVFPLKFLAGSSRLQKDQEIVTYESPYLVDGKMVGYLFVYLKSQDYVMGIKGIKLKIGLVALLMIALILTFNFIRKILKTYVFEPVNALHSITKEMEKGNLETPLIYDYEDEVGQLCHDFEEMRSLLYAKNKYELEAKEKEKTLLACISHDLRTPLCGILGYVEGIKNHIVTDQKGIDSYADIIIHKVNLLTTLIDDILEDTKTDLNVMSFSMEELYLKSYLEPVIDDLMLYAKREGVTLTTDAIPNVLVRIDQKRMQQVFYNLVNNSVKYKKEEGDSTIAIHFFENKRNEKRELVVSVEDNGIGIWACDLPFIFDKFYRGDKARSSQIQGSGLGLNISSYIVKKHGGQIECDSIRGVGTTISFSIPI